MFVTVGFFLNDNVLCYVNTNETAVIGGASPRPGWPRPRPPGTAPTPPSATR